MYFDAHCPCILLLITLTAPIACLPLFPSPAFPPSPSPPSPGSPQIGAQPTSEEWNLDGKVAQVGGVAVVVKALGRPEARANLKKLWLL